MRTIHARFGLTLAGTLLASVFALPASAADVTQERLVNADSEPQNWLTPLQNFSSHRYSRLDQINRDNIGDLHVAFTMPMATALAGGIGSGIEAPPLVIDGMMYVNDAWGTVYKVDVTDGMTPRIMWVTDPAVDKDGNPFHATRGVAALGDKIYGNMVDGRAIALDAESGEIVWDMQVGGKEENWEFDAGEGFSAAPLATEGKILVGQSKGDWGTRGWLAALDAETGEEQWRTYTVPGPGEPGHETWKDEHNAWRTGGGSLWQTGSYDPDQRVTIWGTANPVPMFDPEFRPGDNLFTNSAIAFNIDDGSMAWYFQYTQNESWDYDEIGVHILIDAEFNGEQRKLVAHYARNGFFYLLDGNNGQFLSAQPFVSEITWTAGIDPKTGKPVEYDPNLDVQTYIPATRYDRGNPTGDICPTTVGGVRWQPPAYNPETHIAYIAGGDGCNSIQVEASEPIGPEGGNPKGVNQNFLGGTSPFTAPMGLLASFDVTTGMKVAAVNIPYHNMSGVLATAGGLIFTGNLDGRVAAYNSDSLEEVWGFNTGIVIKAPPIAYAIGDKEYIAIIAAAPGAPSDAKPNLDYMREGAALYVFSL